MRIGRTLPPAAAPIYLKDVISGLKGLVRGQRELTRFETEIKDYFCVKHCFLVSSGKAALTCILLALKDLHPDRDEVLIPAFTCYSVPSAIVRAGLKVRLCDIDSGTLDFDHEQLPELLSRSVLAVMPTHLFGLPADVQRTRVACKDPEITIIEDAAQAMGGECKGGKCGTLGDVAFFSLGRGKAISTFEGGIILTSRDDIAESLRIMVDDLPACDFPALATLVLKALLLALFLHPSIFWLPKAIPSLKLGQTTYDPQFEMRRMSTFQAGLATDWIKRLAQLIKARLIRIGYWVHFVKNGRLRHYCSARVTTPNLIRFPVAVNGNGLRSAILAGSEAMGFGMMPAYPGSIAAIEDLKASFSTCSFAKAKELAEQLVTLPVHPFVKEEDVLRTSRFLERAFRR